VRDGSQEEIPEVRNEKATHSKKNILSMNFEKNEARPTQQETRTKLFQSSLA
jgi:hypothetical protein